MKNGDASQIRFLDRTIFATTGQLMTEDGIKKLLKPYRRKIDKLDDEILKLLGLRFRVIRTVAGLKAKRDIPPLIAERVAEVCNRAVAQSRKHGIDPGLIRMLYTLIIYHSCEMEAAIQQQGRKKRPAAG
jgi:chorismate mutase